MDLTYFDWLWRMHEEAVAQDLKLMFFHLWRREALDRIAEAEAASCLEIVYVSFLPCLNPRE